MGVKICACMNVTTDTCTTFWFSHLFVYNFTYVHLVHVHNVHNVHNLHVLDVKMTMNCENELSL